MLVYSLITSSSPSTYSNTMIAHVFYFRPVQYLVAPCVVFIFYHKIPDAVNKRADISLPVSAVHVRRIVIYSR